MLSTRLLSIVILVPVVALFVYQGGFLFAIMVGIVAALALNEFFGMLSRQGDRPLRVLGGGATALLLLHGLGLGDSLQPAAIALVVFGGLLWELASYRESAYLRGWALTIAGVFYIAWPLSLGIAIRQLPDPAGLYWVIVVISAIWSCDSGGYIGGRILGSKLWGKRPFSRWSPNKTWEGFFVGIGVSLLVTAGLSTQLLGLPLWQALLLGVLLGPACVFGDLAESMVKRRVGVKDSGDLIPGHGGMLDRIDSLLFGIVVAYFFTRWLVY